MTSMQWYATSALRASSSVTSPPLAAGPTGAGRDPGSSAQSVSVYFKPLCYVMYVKVCNQQVVG